MTWKWDRRQTDTAREQSRRARDERIGRVLDAIGWPIREKPKEKPKPDVSVNQYLFPRVLPPQPIRIGGGAGTYIRPLNPPRELPTRQQVEPIRAWKWAHLVHDHGRIMLQGVGQNVRYRPDDKATCANHANRLGRQMMLAAFGFGEATAAAAHVVPSADCSCGFYALPTVEALKEARYSAPAILEVELFGRIIRHEKGYRAERQRVLGVWLQPACTWCAHDARHVQLCGCDIPGCSAVSYACDDLSVFHLSRDSRLVSYPEIPIADLSNQLGVEVRWGKPG